MDGSRHLQETPTLPSPKGEAMPQDFSGEVSALSYPTVRPSRRAVLVVAAGTLVGCAPVA